MTNRVLCLRPEADFTRVDAPAPASLQVTYRAPTDPQLAALLQDSDALIIPAVGPNLAPELFDGAKLRLVQITGIGVDRLDRPALTRLGVPVANVAGGNSGAVVEYVLAATLTLLRRFGWADAELKAGRYNEFRASMVGDNLRGLEGLTVGIVGFGVIGRAVAQAFHNTGCHICFHDPASGNADFAASLDARALPLEELLAISDVVTLHVPLIAATQNLIGARELSRMKPGALLIQASRGGVVDEAALAVQLASGRLGGAAVDVYSKEPPPADNPLFKVTGDAAARLLLTPHIAGVSRQSWTTLFSAAWQNVERVLVKGEPPQNRVY